VTTLLNRDGELREAKLRDVCVDIGRGVAAGACSGLVAGLVAGGVGSRVAMRIVALTASSEQQGAITDAEATVGQITLEGTLFLLFVGALIGAAGGVIYAGTRSWLRWGGPWRGTLFGAALLALFGATIVRGDNPDFAQFGYAWLNIALFSAIIVLFGAIVAPVYERVHKRLRPSLSLTGLVATTFLGAGVVVSVGGGAALLAFVIGGDGGIPAQGWFAIAALAALIATAPFAGQILDAVRAGRLPAYAAVGTPLLAGLAFDTRALIDIFS
jgi:hypothetical protein